MKKHVLPLVAVLLLASCIGVEDFGAYWDKGVVDPALEGTWNKIGLPGKDPRGIPGSDQLRFVKDGLSYALQAINPVDLTLSPAAAEQRKKDNDAPMPVRTLRIGNHQFLLTTAIKGPRGGTMERYEITDDLLLQYAPRNEAILEFLGTKHPTARNIAKNRGEGRFVVINIFDDEVFQILSEISDDPAYWRLQCQYKKIP